MDEEEQSMMMHNLAVSNTHGGGIGGGINIAAGTII
jgi:hypothetical protein